jgi:hypothetical protein
MVYARRRRGRGRNDTFGGLARDVTTVHLCAHKLQRQLSTRVPRSRVTFDTPAQTGTRGAFRAGGFHPESDLSVGHGPTVFLGRTRN